MTIRALYRQAAITQQLHDRAQARLDIISALLVRRIDTRHSVKSWRGPSKRIVRVVTRRKILAFDARTDARTQMLYDPHVEKERELALAQTLENVRRYTMLRKRELS